MKTVRTRLQGEGANSRGRSFNFSLHQLGRQSFVEKKIVGDNSFYQNAVLD